MLAPLSNESARTGFKRADGKVRPSSIVHNGSVARRRKKPCGSQGIHNRVSRRRPISTQCTAVFGTFGDCFTSTPPSRFNDCLFTPLYFSFVTITTLGYGDHSPQTGIGKVLVCLEVTTGLFLFLVVLQRAISSPNETKPCDRINSDE